MIFIWNEIFIDINFMTVFLVYVDGDNNDESATGALNNIKREFRLILISKINKIKSIGLKRA